MKIQECIVDAERRCRLEVVEEGAQPPCVEASRILCRGCPGWSYMIAAVYDPNSRWGEYPVHCSATRLTLRRLP